MVPLLYAESMALLLLLLLLLRSLLSVRSHPRVAAVCVVLRYSISHIVPTRTTTSTAQPPTLLLQHYPDNTLQSLQ